MTEDSSTNDISIAGTRLDFFSVSSTLDIAREQAGRGAPHGTLITATHQTAGRGRRGAQWFDEPGASALMTFVLRPRMAMSSAWRLPFMASLACVEYLREAGCAAARVKWPNDLMAHGAKIGGMLVETVEDGGAVYLLGIGVNVAQRSFAESAEFVNRPISLRMLFEEGALSNQPNAAEVIDGVSAHLDRVWRTHLDSGGLLLEKWREFQTVGHAQSGIALDSALPVRGVYRDVRIQDGAGLIEVENSGSGGLVAVMPSAA